MASIGSVTRQIAALEISAKQNGATKPTRHSQDGRATQSSTKQSASTPQKPMATQKPLTEAELNIGKYDGGFEIENEKCGEAIQGEAARELALDSSVSRTCPMREWHLTDLDIGRPLGKGKFGRVYMARTKVEPNYILALKCLYKSEIVQARVEKQVRRKIEIQHNLRHPNVLRLNGYFHATTRSVSSSCSSSSRSSKPESRNSKGELYKQLTKYGSLSEHRSVVYIDQMADALSYLHSKH
ncbi:kinase-like domain-containing protein, partial [Lactarius pseudohatsudake]